VVIVDDQAPFRDAAEAVLGAMTGFTVVGTADTGEAGLAQILSRQPDLVLLDVNLPDLSGVEVARSVAKDRPATLVVLVSTYDETEFGDEVSQCGAAGYLSKSDFGADRLLDLLDGRRRCGQG
jgi:DNA-binding NarL/FixJ family response regulator